MNIEHIAVWARDIEMLRAFYEKYFAASSSLKYTNETKGFSSYFLSAEWVHYRFVTRHVADQPHRLSSASL